MRGLIDKRGHPDDRPYAPRTTIHLRVPAAVDGTRDAQPACRTGSWHLWWSDDPQQVTCHKCRAQHILDAAQRFVDERRAAGWTRQDFATALREMLEER